MADDLGNNLFVDAIDVSAGLVVTGSNVGYDMEPVETYRVDGYDLPIGSTAWFRWHSAESVPNQQVALIGSDFDTYLVVWAGTGAGDTLSSIDLVTQDDDSGGEFTSLCTFDASYDITYYFQVGGYAGAQGNYVLTPPGRGFNSVIDMSTVVAGELSVPPTLAARLDSFATATATLEVVPQGFLPGATIICSTDITCVITIERQKIMEWHGEADLSLPQIDSIPMTSAVGTTTRQDSVVDIPTGGQSVPVGMSTLSPYYV